MHRFWGIALVLILCACAAKQEAPKPTLPYLATVIATEGTITPRATLAGIMAPTLNIGLQSGLAEPADALYVKEGAYVRRGQPLARLDTADLQAARDADLAAAMSDRANTTHTVYAGSLAIDQGSDALRSAQATVAQAQASLARDRRDLARYQTLLIHGYISQQQADQEATTVRTDEQTLQAAQAALQSAHSNVRANGTLSGQGLQSSAVAQSRANEQVALAQAEQARVQIQKALITSPVDGLVVNRNLNPGEYPGTRQIFTIQQVDPIYAILHGSGAQIADIRPGAAARIIVDDLHGRAFSGKVTAVLNQIVPGSTNFEVKIAVMNPDLLLRPGMAVAGTIILPTGQGVRIPETAFTDDTHTTVMTVDADGTLHAAHVTEIANDGRDAVVGGLEVGARLLGNGQTDLTDGRRVAFQ